MKKTTKKSREIQMTPAKQLILKQEIAKEQQLKDDKEFIEDAKSLPVIQNYVTNVIFYLKYKAIKDAVKQNKTEIFYDAPLNDWANNWIWNELSMGGAADKHTQNLYFKQFVLSLQEDIEPLGFTISQIGDLPKIKISWDKETIKESGRVF